VEENKYLQKLLLKSYSKIIEAPLELLFHQRLQTIKIERGKLFIMTYFLNGRSDTIRTYELLLLNHWALVLRKPLDFVIA